VVAITIHQLYRASYSFLAPPSTSCDILSRKIPLQHLKTFMIPSSKCSYAHHHASGRRDDVLLRLSTFSCTMDRNRIFHSTKSPCTTRVEQFIVQVFVANQNVLGVCGQPFEAVVQQGVQFAIGCHACEFGAAADQPACCFE